MKKFQSVNVPIKDYDRLKNLAEQERRSIAKELGHIIDHYFQQKEAS